MDLGKYLRTEGKQEHGTILYRRLALLPGLCDGSNGVPSAAVLRGHPPVPPDEETQCFRRDYMHKLAPPKRPKSSGVRSDTTTLKQGLKRKVLPGSAVIPEHKKPPMRNETPEEKVLNGFERLHEAICNTVTNLANCRNFDISGSFERLAYHIRGYTHSYDSERLLGLLNTFLSDPDVDTSKAGTARLALFFLDHVFYLINSLHPCLKKVLCWCRQELCDALYCPVTNIDIKDMGTPESEMDKDTFAGVPKMPSERSSEQAIIGNIDFMKATITAYRGRLNFEDNTMLQDGLKAKHQLIKEEREYTMRLLEAEKSVCMYWKRATKGRLFYGWRNIIQTQKKEKRRAEDKLLLERELALSKRATQEQIKVRARVEASLYEEMAKLDSKVTQSLSTIADLEHQLQNEKDTLKDIHRQLFQHKAEQVLLRDRLKRNILKLEKSQEKEQQACLELQTIRTQTKELQESTKQYDAMLDACKSTIAKTRMHSSVLKVSLGHGLLPRWLISVFGTIHVEDTLCDKLVVWLRQIFPTKVSEQCVLKVQNAEDDIEKSRLMYEVIRNIGGDATPFHRNSFMFPVHTTLMPNIVAMVLSIACAPTEGMWDDDDNIPDAEVVEQLLEAAKNVRYSSEVMKCVVKDLIRWPKGGMGSVLSCKNPSEWMPNETYLKMHKYVPSGGMQCLENRVAEYSYELSEVREAYSTVIFMRDSVFDLVNDADFSVDGQKHAMDALPPGVNEEILPRCLSTALTCAAVIMYPQVPPDEAFELIMHEHVMRSCKGLKDVNFGSAFLLYRPQLSFLYSKLGPNIRFGKIKSFVASKDLLVEDSEDTFDKLTPTVLKKVFDHSLRPGEFIGGNDPALDFHHFLVFLVHVSQVLYPLPTLSISTKVKMLLKNHIANRYLKT